MDLWNSLLDTLARTPREHFLLASASALIVILLLSQNRSRRKAKITFAQPDGQAKDLLAEIEAARSEFIDNEKTEEWNNRANEILNGLREIAIPEHYPSLRKLRTVFKDEFRPLVDEWNHDFIRSESERLNDFFGRLDARQREACLSDEMATLVVAGAGSGKTSTIQKKVEYLVQIKGVAPQDILLLSFTNKAADEMTSRLQEALPEANLHASTFHKFALRLVKVQRDTAFDICEPQFCRKTILKALSPESLTDEQCRGLLRYFAYCLNAEPEDLDNVKSKGDYINMTRTASLQTFRGMTLADRRDKTTYQGEMVKSFEELEIANWLFLNGISYEYEKQYDKPLPPNPDHHRIYKPDFYLPDYDIWIEHFGIDEHGEPPPFFSKAERIAYKKGIEWKRQLHKQNNTQLVESYSWWHRKAQLTDLLWEALKRRGVKVHRVDPKPLWKQLLSSQEDMFLREFAQLTASFIALAKSHKLGPDQILTLRDKSSATGATQFRLNSFLAQAQWLYRRYEEALQEDQALDFHDMINDAIDVVGGISGSVHPYRYVIIDEFQDISVGRAKLIQSVIKATGAKLFCVGDDWQSIYRFAGSDISIFTHFAKHFGFTRTINLENTYRNSTELLDVAGAFIMKNRQQLKKQLSSSLHCARPVVCVPYGDNKTLHEALMTALTEIAHETKDGPTSVLLLGRHNSESAWPCTTPGLLVNKTGDVFTWEQHPKMKITFMTIHKAKGLEADYIILLNFKNDLLGFPNRIADDPILSLLLADPEGMPFAEERRVFYVALTRTKNRAYILTPRANASVFLDDLPAEAQQLLHADQEEPLTCPSCKTGHLVLRKKRSGDGTFYGCSNYPRCDYTLPEQHPPLSSETPRCSCGGYLVPRRNPKTGRMFLGCTEYQRLPSFHHTALPLPRKEDQPN